MTMISTLKALGAASVVALMSSTAFAAGHSMTIKIGTEGAYPPLTTLILRVSLKGLISTSQKPFVMR